MTTLILKKYKYFFGKLLQWWTKIKIRLLKEKKKTHKIWSVEEINIFIGK